MGHGCIVVALSLIPSKTGDRVKTDRRDSEGLTRLHRANELTSVCVSNTEQESIRDLTRAREDMKHLERQSRQRLSAFLLRHGQTYDSGKSKYSTDMAIPRFSDATTAGASIIGILTRH